MWYEGNGRGRTLSASIVSEGGNLRSLNVSGDRMKIDSDILAIKKGRGTQ